MANARVSLTARDGDILRAIEYCPLTVRQLRSLSTTFAAGFSSDRRLQHRLAQLTHAGLLRRFRYAATDRWGEYYYVLSREGYRLLQGNCDRRSSGLFRSIGISRQHHTHRLAEFVVKTMVAAHEIGATIMQFARENTVRLTVRGDHLYPDAVLNIAVQDRPPFAYYVELDNSTEPLASSSQRDSWVKKLHFYEALQDSESARFRVLGIATRSQARLRNLVSLAATIGANPQRSLFYGVYLPDFLQHVTPLTAPLFHDHRGLRVSLLPSNASAPLLVPPAVSIGIGV